MLLAQRLDLTAFRRDPLRIIARVVGDDLSAATVTYGVGLYRDIDPAFRSLVLTNTLVIGGDGVRLVRVERSPGDQPVSVFEIIASKPLMALLPRTGEIGDDVSLAHELQVDRLTAAPGFSPVETTLFFGTLTIKGSVND